MATSCVFGFGCFFVSWCTVGLLSDHSSIPWVDHARFQKMPQVMDMFGITDGFLKRLKSIKKSILRHWIEMNWNELNDTGTSMVHVWSISHVSRPMSHLPWKRCLWSQRFGDQRPLVSSPGPQFSCAEASCAPGGLAVRPAPQRSYLRSCLRIGWTLKDLPPQWLKYAGYEWSEWYSNDLEGQHGPTQCWRKEVEVRPSTIPFVQNSPAGAPSRALVRSFAICTSCSCSFKISTFILWRMFSRLWLKSSAMAAPKSKAGELHCTIPEPNWSREGTGGDSLMGTRQAVILWSYWIGPRLVQDGWHFNVHLSSSNIIYQYARFIFFHRCDILSTLTRHVRVNVERWTMDQPRNLHADRLDLKAARATKNSTELSKMFLAKPQVVLPENGPSVDAL